MNRKVIGGFVAGIIVVLIALYFIGANDESDKKPAAKPPASQTTAANKPAAPAAPPAPQAAVKDPRKYLTVEDVINITGTKFKLTYVDMKYNGKPDMTFSTTDEGHIALTVTILPGSYYEKYYNEFRSQDYKAMENAFWGPKSENPPRMLGFRKGDTMIVLLRHIDDGQYYVSVEMLERLAKTIAARL